MHSPKGFGGDRKAPESTLLKCGYDEQSIKTASPGDMKEYYSEEKQQKYGDVGIEIEVI